MQKTLYSRFLVLDKPGKVEYTHYGEGTSSARVNKLNPFVDDHDGNQAGGYDDYHKEGMLNETFSYEHNNIASGRKMNSEAFYNVLHSVRKPLYEGYQTHCEFSATMWLLNIKLESNLCN